VTSKSGYQFKVKAIRKVILASLCNDCLVRDMCKEWYYGIRIEQQNNVPLARLCIDRQDFPAVQHLSEFFNSDQYKEIESIRK
jgi:hypothetical protein